MSETYAFPNTSISIIFSAEGEYDLISATWSYNGVHLVADGLKYVISEDRLTLFISSLSLADEGRYELRIENEAGETSGSVTLDLQSEF